MREAAARALEPASRQEAVAASVWEAAWAEWSGEGSAVGMREQPALVPGAEQGAGVVRAALWAEMGRLAYPFKDNIKPP